MIKSELFELWSKKELAVGHHLTIGEVAEATGLSRDAVTGLLNDETSRFDAHVLAALCEYFGVEEGETIPFLKVRYLEPA